MLPPYNIKSKKTFHIPTGESGYATYSFGIHIQEGLFTHNAQKRGIMKYRVCPQKYFPKGMTTLPFPFHIIIVGNVLVFDELLSSLVFSILSNRVFVKLHRFGTMFEYANFLAAANVKLEL